VTSLAGADMALPAGIQWSDLAFISAGVLIVAVVTATIGILVLRQVAAHSIRLMITIVVAVCLVTAMAGVGIIAARMLGSDAERDEILDLMAIAGLAGLAVALFLGRRLAKASRAISSAVQGVAETGVYLAPPLKKSKEL